MTDIPKLIERLRTVSNMINMGDRIDWGEDTALMDDAADALSTAYRQGLQDAAGVAANTVRHVNLYRGRPIVFALCTLNPTDATEGEKNNG